MRVTTITMMTTWLVLLLGMQTTVAHAQVNDGGVGGAGGDVEGGEGVEAPPPSETPPTPPQQPIAQPATAQRETVCDDRRDDDGDGLADCADADCFEDAVCHAGGNAEANNDRCSDWIDNDGDGAVDCDDDECSGPGINVCQGSFHGGSGGGAANTGNTDEDIPELSGDMTVEDLIGNFGDADGERNDYLCSDGIDNDGDGRTDCADFGCRFDTQVSVCQGAAGFRFSVVTGVSAGYEYSENALDPAGPVATSQDFYDVVFQRIQLRALGSIPYINDSFFLLNVRLEQAPRLTFAVFQVPLGDTGHYINVNSGSGGLTSGLIISTSKQPLLDPPYYLFNAFEQGNGAALEVGGPLVPGFLRYRAFAAGGSGFGTGNVGGRFFRDDTRNFAWNAGAQLNFNFIGSYDRFDTPFLYTPVPLGLALLVGGKYDQRARERFPAANAQLIFQWSRFLVRGEVYSKYVMDYGGAFQSAWNAQASILIIPEHLMLAADIGSFFAQDFQPGPGTVAPTFDAALRRPLDEFQWRVALHWFWFRNIGLMTLLWRETQREENPDNLENPILERELRLEAQFRF